jgi:lipopolysaccharide transport system ATP-binding protein
MESMIEINNLSKKYKYGETQLYYTFRDILMDLIKKPLKLFNKKSETINLEKNEFWALKDISFKVKKGEAVGIIGPNGAGKSTLLKILSRITPPTKGEAILGGRVGSLLEVGTGFQQELTGRENIYLNGAILGMKRREIDDKFDEIVNFSEMYKFLDTPVKHYSSGMYMRLAFSVAAHLDSEIMIVDEVLAVGDAEFQKKCLRKIKEITKDGTRTVLFVSHNMSAVSALCKRSIYLNKGVVEYDGYTKVAVNKYMRHSNYSQKDNDKK